MLTVAIGPPLIEVLTLAYHANQPVLLHGRHGIGKSETLDQAAAQLGIALIVRDLSLMEPPDLVGIPRVGQDERTHYAPPAFLPHDGQGLLVFEELNRCARYMQAPCLQLLTARQLNDYRLPPGWLPCAAINDAADGYQTEDLDLALLSRFLHVQVVPEVGHWLTWAQQHGVHPKVQGFVASSPGVFDDPAANPRAWTKASTLLTAWERMQAALDLLILALAGVLGEKWALAFLQFYGDACRPLRPAEILADYPAHRAALRRWVAQGRLDVVVASVEALQRHLQPQPVYEGMCRDGTQKSNVEALFADLPAELQRQVAAWLTNRGFDALTVPTRLRRGRP